MTFIIAIFLAIFFVIYFRKLDDRISHLEMLVGGETKVGKGTVEGISTKSESANVASIKPEMNNEERLQAIRSQLQGGEVAVRPHEGHVGTFGNWLKEDWLMKLGAFLFIIGVGWFVSYAFANDWIGPVGRITLGIVTGISIMAFGFYRMLKNARQGAIFLSLGAGSAMLTVFAGRAVYNFFTPEIAVVFDFLLASFVAFASYKFKVKSLAYVGQFLGFVAPLLVAGPSDTMLLFSYLYLITLSSMALLSYTGWRGLSITNLLYVSVFVLPYLNLYGGRVGNDHNIVLNFVYLFVATFFVSGIISILKNGASKLRTEIAVSVLNGFLLLFFIGIVAPNEWRSILFSIWAVTFVIGSFVTFRVTGKLAPLFSYGSVAAMLIASALASELEGSIFIIAIIIEIFAIVFGIYALTRNVKATSIASILYIIPAFFSIASIDDYARSRELFNEHFAVMALMSLALILSGRLLTASVPKEEREKKATVGATLVIFGTLYIWVTIWYFFHTLIRDEGLATFAVLVIYTIAGLIAYFIGLKGGDGARKAYGAFLLGFVVARLLLIDVWDLELFARVITFLGIGVLLMSTAFFGRKKILPANN